MTTTQTEQAAREWAREDIVKGREEGRSGSLMSALVPAFMAGAEWQRLTTPPAAPVQADQFVLFALDRAVTLLRSTGDRNSSKDDPYGGLFWYDDADLIETFVTRTRAAP